MKTKIIVAASACLTALALAVLAVFVTGSGGAVAQQNPPNVRAPNATIVAPVTPVKTPACPTKCAQGRQEIYQPVDGQCELQFTVPCYPGSCDKDGRFCRVKCGTQSDCGPNAACDTSGQCVPNVSACYSAAVGREANGHLFECSPYRCAGGQCRATCSVDSDCADGAVCNTQGRCIKKN